MDTPQGGALPLEAAAAEADDDDAGEPEVDGAGEPEVAAVGKPGVDGATEADATGDGDAVTTGLGEAEADATGMSDGDGVGVGRNPTGSGPTKMNAARTPAATRTPASSPARIVRADLIRRQGTSTDEPQAVDRGRC